MPAQAASYSADLRDRRNGGIQPFHDPVDLQLQVRHLGFDEADLLQKHPELKAERITTEFQSKGIGCQFGDPLNFAGSELLL